MDTETVDRRAPAGDSRLGRQPRRGHRAVAAAVLPAPAQYAQPPQYQAPYQPQYQQPAPAGGGALQRFLGGRFGQAIVTGAGIGIGDDIVNSIFDSF